MAAPVLVPATTTNGFRINTRSLGFLLSITLFMLQLAGIVWSASRMASRLDTATHALDQVVLSNTTLTETVVQLRSDVAVLKSQVQALEKAAGEKRR